MKTLMIVVVCLVLREVTLLFDLSWVFWSAFVVVIITSIYYLANQESEYDSDLFLQSLIICGPLLAMVGVLHRDLFGKPLSQKIGIAFSDVRGNYQKNDGQIVVIEGGSKNQVFIKTKGLNISAEVVGDSIFLQNGNKLFYEAKTFLNPDSLDYYNRLDCRSIRGSNFDAKSCEKSRFDDNPFVDTGGGVI